MFELKLKKYKNQILKRKLLALFSIVLSIYTIYVMLFKSHYNLFEVLIIFCGGVYLAVMLFKVYKMERISISDIITKDCDAELWLYYCEKQKEDNNITWKLEYINALNLDGQLIAAKKELNEINFNALSNKFKLLYLYIKNDNCFYLSDIAGVYSVKERLSKYTIDNNLITSKIQLNKAYIDCLQKEPLRSENPPLIKVDTESLMLSRVKLAYVMYLNLTVRGDLSEANKIRQFILTNGGTLFFVKKI